MSKPPKTPASSRVSAAEQLARRSRKVLHYIMERRLTVDDRSQRAMIMNFVNAEANERMIKNALYRWLRACQLMCREVDQAERDLAKLLSRGCIESTR